MVIARGKRDGIKEEGGKWDICYSVNNKNKEKKQIKIFVYKTQG